jgi:hypothetical protein
MRHEVFMAVTMKIVFWDVTPYSPPIFTNISGEPDASIFRVSTSVFDGGFLWFASVCPWKYKDNNSDY